jgi:hypothetical protein
VPLNQRITATPLPQQNGLFVQELEMHEANVMQAFSVPPAVMQATHAARFASQTDIALRGWQTTIRRIQTELATVITEVFMFSTEKRFLRYAEAVIGTVVAPVHEEAEQAVVAAISRNDDGVMQLGDDDESVRRAAAILSVTNADIVAHLRAGLTVCVHFHNPAALTLQELATLREQGLISRERHARLVAEVSGLPEDMFLLTSEDAKADAQERQELAALAAGPEGETPQVKRAKTAN